MTKALHNLTTLADELAENSGVDSSLKDGWSLLKGMAVPILTVFGYCIIPRVRGLVQRLIATAVSKQMLLKPPPYSDNLLLLEESEVGKEQSQKENVKHYCPGWKHHTKHHVNKVQKRTAAYKRKRGYCAKWQNDAFCQNVAFCNEA